MDRAANKNCGRGQANEPGRSARPVSLAGGEAEECQERAGRLNENRHAAFARRRPRPSEVDGRFWIVPESAPQPSSDACAASLKKIRHKPSAPARAGGRFAAGAKTSYGNASADGNTTAAASRIELVNTSKGKREDRDADDRSCDARASRSSRQSPWAQGLQKWRAANRR